MTANTQLRLRGKLVSEDNNGNINLKDIWVIAGSTLNKDPYQWSRRDIGKHFIDAAYKKITGKEIRCLTPNKRKKALTSVFYGKKGRSGATFAHPLIAAKYAGYLDPNLEVKIVEVWLRYRAGDPKLADEILERASAEANRWAGLRAISRAVRNGYTSTLKLHGTTGYGYANCTNVIYRQILGANAKQLLNSQGLQESDNLRDNLPERSLSFVTAAESLATERIEEEDCFGFSECYQASKRSAGYLKEAIEKDRADRVKKAS